MSQSEAYNDAHRSFLQLIAANRLLTAPKVNAAYEAACSKYGVGSCGGLQQFVMAINASLSPLHLIIKKSVQEDLREDKSCFVLVNTISSDVLKGLSSRSAWEDMLLERIISGIVESEEGCIAEVDAVNMGTGLQGHRVTASESEAAIARMIKSKLIIKHDDMLLLSGLTLSEQQQQLEANFPDICVKCVLCKIITLQGYSCDQCNSRVHRSCGRKLWRKAERLPFCPGCNAVWPRVNSVSASGGE
ncbi:non-structural maintenance of chromosomes element 1 homolog [Hyalella azteca]|uniref:Non-structural maintenance of chromosomes element 1 homolog n=1 Tax=Hyalella azteca TaxID=294128 RepID=A0A8B7N903_HYAAZ|nr:non-structural maintenance of chromosomes element 1 homolog [Hyalella azteca]